jgi:molybdopterin molybdotransferase
MLEPREAARRIVDAIAPLPSVTLPLGVAAGFVLAEELRAPIAMPRWDNSAMDGYACRAIDVAGATATAPVRLPVVASVRAGDAVPTALQPGTAVRIATGAPVPAGADTVIRIEDSDTGRDVVEIRDARDAGRNVRPAGEDIAAGGLVAAAGDRLTPGRLGLLAAVGVREVPVHRRPRVAIVATGDELVPLADFDPVARPDRIVSSNSVTLAALITEAGGEPLDLGIVPDRPEALREALAAAAASADLVLTTAGVSVGEHDHVRATVTALQGAVDFWRVRMRPGSPLAAGRIGRTPWIGLPGNPVSTLVTFTLFAAPALRRLAGARAVFPWAIPVRTRDEIRVSAPLTQFLRVRLDEATSDDGLLGAWLTGPQGSNISSSVAAADALLIVPPDSGVLPAGTRLRAIPLGGGLLGVEPA